MLRFATSHGWFFERLRKVAPALVAGRAAAHAVLHGNPKTAGHKARSYRRRAEFLEPRTLLSVGGVTYQGGPLINNVAVEPVFLGQAWASDPQLVQTANRLNQFFGFLTNSSYMDLLHEYGTPQAGPIGHGSLAASLTIAQNFWRRGAIDDRQIQAVLNQEIAGGGIAPPDSNRLLFVFTPPNVVVTHGGAASDGVPSGFAGYHSSFVDSSGALVRYAVIPDPIGNDQAALAPFDQQTAAASHEMAEAVTDPDGTSWWDATSDATAGYEIGDFADLSSDTVNLGGYAVEALWSNAQGGLVAPAGSTQSPGSGALPPSVGIPPAANSATPPNLGGVAMSLTHSTAFEVRLIAQDYQQYIGRSPDAAGLSYWITRIETGMTDEQLTAALVSSPEYVQTHGGNDSLWIDAMYHDLLGRGADLAGGQHWQSVLASGGSRYEVALGIATSAEHEALVVANDYFIYLGRTASPAEINYWVGQLEHGALNEDVVAGFLASPEYFDSSSKGQGTAIGWLESAYQDLFDRAPTNNELAYWLPEL